MLLPRQDAPGEELLDSRADEAVNPSPSFNKEQEENYFPSQQPLDSSTPTKENGGFLQAPVNPPLPPESHPQQTVNLNSTSSTMANFPVNPQAFLVAGLTVDHGWNRPARGRIALGGEPTREHENYAIVSVTPMRQQVGELRPMLNIISDFLENDQKVRIEAAHLSPLGLGLIKLRSMVQHDKLVRNSPFNLGQNHVVRVVKHDEGINSRSCTYTRVCWLMFLAFPLDFQKDLYVRAAVASYGRLLDWYMDENKSRILVQALLLSPDRVPRSLIVSRGTMIGGMGHSWTVPVYILNGKFPDAFLADEDDVLFDGEPHPDHPPVVMGPHPLNPNW